MGEVSNQGNTQGLNVRAMVARLEQTATPAKTTPTDAKTTKAEQGVLNPEANHASTPTTSVKRESQTSVKQSTSGTEELKTSLSNVAIRGVESVNSGRKLPPTPTKPAANDTLPPNKTLPDLPSTGNQKPDVQEGKLIPIPMREEAVSTSYKFREIDPQVLAKEINQVKDRISGGASTAKLAVTHSTIKMIQDYKSGDAQKLESAKAKVRGLSNKNIKTLLDIMDNKPVSNSRMSALSHSLNKPSALSTLFHTSSTSKILDRIDAKLSNVSAYSAIDATYKTDGKGIDDIAYVNERLQLAYVVDGTGHGNPLMAEGLNKIFNSFNAEYEENRANQGLNRDFVVKNLGNLESKLVRYDKNITDDPNKSEKKFTYAEYHPAMSFVQIIPGEGDNRTLISAQYNDTMFMVMHKKSSPEQKTTFYETNVKTINSGVGGSALMPASTKEREEVSRNKRINDKHLAELPVKAGDVVYLFSDGIGEYLTKEEVQTILDANKYPHLLLDEFKNKIIAKGIEFREELKAIDSMTDPIKRKEADEEIKNRTPANQQNFKHHDPANEDQMDDLSVAILKIT